MFYCDLMLFVFTGMFRRLVTTAAVITLMCAMYLITCGNRLTTLNHSFNTAKAMVTADKDVNTLVITVEDTDTLVGTGVPDANTLVTAKDANAAKDTNTLVTAKDANTATKDTNTLVIARSANTPVTARSANTPVTAQVTKGARILVTAQDTKGTNTPVTTQVTKSAKTPVTGKHANTLVTSAVDATNTPITTEDAKMPEDKTVLNKNIRYAIAYHYFEQQTNALLNMWTMQKWAKFTGFKVVEPFVYRSFLGFSYKMLEHCNSTNSLRFGDYFDLDFWTNESTKKFGIPPFEKWETFVLSPLKKTVVVILAYEVSSGGQYVDNDINKHQGCVKQTELFYSRHAKLFDKLQIQVVRNVCFAFHYKAVSLQLFNSLILPDENVNVWFSTWRGIQGGGRIPISDHQEMHLGHDGLTNVLAMARPSPRVLKDSRKYVNTVLNADFKEYTAVAIRTGNKRTVLVRRGYSKDQLVQYFHNCAQQVHNASLKISSGPIFAAIDLGRFGDSSAYEGYFRLENVGARLFKLILDDIYGNKSIDDYENELIRAANGVDDSGYIGAMQKTIAENAKHLIMVGGYSYFQTSMVSAFNKINNNCHSCISYICYH